MFKNVLVYLSAYTQLIHFSNLGCNCSSLNDTIVIEKVSGWDISVLYIHVNANILSRIYFIFQILGGFSSIVNTTVHNSISLFWNQIIII